MRVVDDLDAAVCQLHARLLLGGGNLLGGAVVAVHPQLVERAFKQQVIVGGSVEVYERDGKYGGSFENRTRLLRESVKGAIENCSKDFIVSSRMNVYDGFEYPYGFGVSKDGGMDFDVTEPDWLIKELYKYGVRILNITMGNPYFNPHVNRPYAQGGYEAPEHPLQGVSRVLKGTAKIKELNPEMAIICSAVSYLGVAAPNVVSAFITSLALGM